MNDEKKILEHLVLGRQFVCHIDPATRRIILKIVGFHGSYHGVILKLAQWKI